MVLPNSIRFAQKVTVFFLIFLLGITLVAFLFPFEIFTEIDKNEISPLLQNVKTYEPSRVLKHKPNPLLLIINADENRNVYLNIEKRGSLDNLSELKSDLKRIFAERKYHKVYESNSINVVKEIIIIPNENLISNDLFNIVKVLEESGANPILIDWNNNVRVEKHFPIINKNNYFSK